MTVDSMGTKERLLRAADELMYAGGFEAVSIADLCEHADARKGSFYHFFGSKQELALEMLDESWQRTRLIFFESSFGNPDLSGLQAVDLYADLLAEDLRSSMDAGGFVGGCRFGNFALEMSTKDSEIQTALVAIFEEMRSYVVAGLRRSVESGEIDVATDLDTAALVVIAQMEGLMVLAKAHEDPSLISSLGLTIRKLLG